MPCQNSTHTCTDIRPKIKELSQQLPFKIHFNTLYSNGFGQMPLKYYEQCRTSYMYVCVECVDAATVSKPNKKLYKYQILETFINL